MKNIGKHVLFVALAVIMPQFAHASVVINEFLYDASGTDTDQEYVELLNTGSSPVDLTKYKINDGSNHTFNVPPKNGGTGSIILPAGGYALIVDNAANFIAGHPGISGAIIDSVLSLNNLGATISLIDDTGAMADSVTYTKDQGANGDGNSLQRLGTSWITALPTPLAANATVAAPPVVVSDDSQSSTSTSSSSSSSSSSSASPSTVVSSYVAPPVAEIFADGGDDRTVIVGADSEFRGRAYDRKQDIVDNVRFNWNFGDGSTAEGDSVMHHFEYPGKYAVVLTIAQNISAASDRIIVTAEPANLAFAVNNDGSVAITNKAGRDIDISHWIVRSFGRTFIFEDDTGVLAGQALRISNATLGFSVGPQTELDYPNGTLALSAGGEPAPAVPETIVAPVAEASVAQQSSSTPDIASDEKPSDETSSADVPAEATQDAPADVVDTNATDTMSSSSVLQAAAAASSSGGSHIWLWGLFGIVIVAGGAAFAVKHVSKGEWNIIEDSSE